MKTTIALFVLVLLHSAPVFANDVNVTKSDVDGFIVHQIDDCPYRRGFGFVSYLADTPSSQSSVLSDYCFDEEAGKFWSAEYIEGLELAVDGPSQQVFEDIDSGAEVYDRTSVTIYALSDINSICTSFMDKGSFVVASKYQPLNLENAYGMFTNGYFFNQVSPVDEDGKYDTLSVVMAFIQSIDGRSTSDLTQHNFNGGAFVGNLDFVDGQAEVLLEGSHNGHVGKNHGGVLHVESTPDGELVGSGYISFENARIRGHGKNEWVSAKGEFIGLRGHAVGDAAQNLKMRGWVRGTFIDINDAVHTFTSEVDFEACDTSNKQ